jgi:hypothetical protein
MKKESNPYPPEGAVRPSPPPAAPSVIPRMTHHLSRAWRQPNSQDILIDDSHALMTRESFDVLAEYSSSIPTGVYEGKMWKRRYGHGWLLCWFANSEIPGQCSIGYRRILLV